MLQPPTERPKRVYISGIGTSPGNPDFHWHAVDGQWCAEKNGTWTTYGHSHIAGLERHVHPDGNQFRYSRRESKERR